MTTHHLINKHQPNPMSILWHPCLTNVTFVVTFVLKPDGDNCSPTTPIFDTYIIQTTLCFLCMLVGRSQNCKVLPKLFKKLLSVDVLWKGVLRLLGGSVAALKVSNLETDKSITLTDTTGKITLCLFNYCNVWMLRWIQKWWITFSQRMEKLKCGSYMWGASDAAVCRKALD